MIKNAIAKTETIATTRTGRYQFKKVPETIDFLLVLLVLGESRTNRRLLTIDSVSYDTELSPSQYYFYDKQRRDRVIYYS